MKYVVLMLAAMASAPAHADCASTVNRAIDRLVDAQVKEALKNEKMTPEMQKMADDMVKEMKPKLKAAMTRSCVDDKWSSEAVKCVDDAADTDAMDRCESTLSALQKANLERAMNAALGTASDNATEAACGDAAKALADLVLGLRAPPASASAKKQVERRHVAGTSLVMDLAAVCLGDRWSEDTISCMKSASSLTDLVTCHQMLAGDGDEHIQAVEIGAIGSASDCVKTTGRAVDRMTDVAEPKRAHMAWALAESCSADWWPTSALTCVAGARTTKALERCEAKLSTSQRADVTAVMSYAMAIGEVMPDDPSLPPECKEYHAVIERLASCDKMPAQARAALRDAYRQAAAGWTNLPPEALANLAKACKAGTKAVSQSAKSVCGW
jgi:hypothetical protein